MITPPTLITTPSGSAMTDQLIRGISWWSHDCRNWLAGQMGAGGGLSLLSIAISSTKFTTLTVFNHSTPCVTVTGLNIVSGPIFVWHFSESSEQGQCKHMARSWAQNDQWGSEDSKPWLQKISELVWIIRGSGRGLWGIGNLTKETFLWWWL